MKKILFTAALLCFMPYWVMSQFSISGKLSDNEKSNPLPFGHISVENTYIVVSSDIDGLYKINNLPQGQYVIRASYLGFETLKKEVNLTENIVLNFDLKQSTTLTEEVIIRATRSSSQNPVAQATINKQEIQSQNLGQDLPLLIQMTPSVVVSSDAGMGIGYTGMNIRGSDGTRINVTVNGIPVNDSESHGVWWVNMPDFASSVENLQIQRGVGTSTNGAAAFGATVNLQTNTLNADKYAEISNTIGSFNSMKNTISFGTGLLPSKWSFDGRMSHIRSDGYIDRASTQLQSYYLSGGYYSDKNIFKLIHFSGKEKTYQAWNGVPGDSLSTNRTFNSAGLYYEENGLEKYYENETDNYQQSHYQAHFSHQINQSLTLSTAGHYTSGKGYYEQYRAGDNFSSYQLPEVIIGNDTITETDLIRQKWLDNKFYGITYSLNYNSFAQFNLIFGGGYNVYEGNHFGEIIWAEISKGIPAKYRYYENDAYKTDLNNYIKVNYQIGMINFFGDVQHRHINYEFLGKAVINSNVEELEQTVMFNFINPKAGFTIELNPQNSIYGFWGIANREPVRKDFTESSPDSRPKHETLNNFEFGYKRNSKNYFLAANAYLMKYKNQLVLTGEINDVGDYSRTNIDGSYRAGLELESSIRFTDFLSWGFNFTYSKNKIKNYIEHYDIFDENWNWLGTDSISYKNTDISFSPNIIAASTISIKPFKNFDVDILSKYVGNQFIDNTSSKDRMLKAYLVNHLKLTYKLEIKLIKHIECIFMVNNFLNEKYITNAWVYNGIINQGEAVALEDGYFPQAGRHFMFGLNLKF
ncbi:MAG: TonB-dependent receptor [Bacteroidales bacterium]|nr:TonB-dependent receptor [Bacteroidales bacterium]